MTETEAWLCEVRLSRAAQLKTAMTLSECGVKVLREAAPEVEPKQISEAQ